MISNDPLCRWGMVQEETPGVSLRARPLNNAWLPTVVAAPWGPFSEVDALIAVSISLRRLSAFPALSLDYSKQHWLPGSADPRRPYQGLP